ncbi:DUF4175 domain-containing protein [Actinophytocola xanthii]|uniref:DUF4175 domain-containing protein n=1 Tax=Actinophytocola xanthii TaxID=1912961 RepID=UPI0011786903|nr:DUF4175 domain-containing protein [Actinophytocola xanthii]
MSWATWIILAIYLVLLAFSVARRHPPFVLGVLIVGTLACAARMFVVEWAWLSILTVALLLVGTIAFRWAW